jgi:hypothetical protein
MAVAPVPIEDLTISVSQNALNLSCKDELDLSILIIKGFGAHKGKITLGAVARPFDYKDVVGFCARGDYSPTYDWPINQG